MTPVISLANGRSRRRKLLLGIGLLTLVILQLLVYQLYLSYREQIRDAETRTLNYAAIFETRLDATLRHSDAILQALARSVPARALDRPASSSDASELAGELDAHLLNFDELVGLRVFDRNGDLRFSSDRAHTPQINVADRDYFHQLREYPGREPLFSEVLVSRASGRPSLIVARALRGPDGVFLGVVSAVLDLNHYLENFRSVDLDREGSIVLRRSDDHRLVVRWPAVPDQLNQTLDAAHPVRQAIGRGDRTGTLHYVAQTDGIYRIHSFQRLERYPFYFNIGASLDDVLAGWRQRALVAGVAGSLLLILLAALLCCLQRSEAREAAGVADLVADISERRQAEEESRNLLQAVEQSPVAIVITNLDGEIEYVNPSFSRVTGYSRLEAIGQNPRLLKSGQTPAETYRTLWRTLLEGRVWSGILHNRRKNGTFFWEKASIAPVFGDHGQVTHYLAVKEDVTERLQAEQQLRESEEAFRRLFEDANDPLLLLKDGVFIDCNKATLELLGYRCKAEFLGQSPDDISPPCQPDGRSSKEEAAAMIVAAHRFGYHRFEWTHQRRDRSTVSVEVTLTPITLRGEVIVHTLWRDISERRVSETRLRLLAGRIRTQRRSDHGQRP
jgi:PAS domain S-box-containing protein